MSEMPNDAASKKCRLGDIAFHRLQKPLLQDVTYFQL